MYTEDWTTTTFSHSFINHALPILSLRNQTELTCIELGCFEGRTTNFISSKLRYSKLICVDPFEDYKEHVSNFDYTGQYERFTFNTKDIPSDRLSVYRCTSDEFFKLYVEDKMFDFAYIDADHHALSVFNDGTNIFPHMKSGGIIIFDDYLWGEYTTSPDTTPKQGIDQFINKLSDKIKILNKDYQVVVQIL